MSESNLDAIGGRKFVLTILILLSGIAMQAIGKFSTELGIFMASVLGVFCGSNAYLTAKSMVTSVAEGVVNSASQEQTPKAQPDAAIMPLLQQIAVTVGQTQEILLRAMNASNERNG
jgi:hypothetical protein